jgi:hypothetical protein
MARREASVITFAEDGKTINPIEAHEREWVLFFIFGLAELDADVEGWHRHIDWVRARFKSPDAWLGPDGDRYRQSSDWDSPGSELVKRWCRFEAAHAADTLADIDKLLRTFLFVA